ncbi:MAG: hypothetical protein IPI19_07660 [Ignavibacteriales bacterium]|nr:hypothetical protein [Ignavibacteriales bacterium]
MSKRVFIGLNNIANVGLSLKSGFEDLGIIADFYTTEKILHKYDYSEKLNVKINRINQNFDIIFSPDECGGYFIEKYITYYFPVEDIGGEKPIIQTATKIKSLRIVHAPSNEQYKGSKHIYDAIDNLKNRYEFEFIKLQNLSKDDLIEEILKCDLVIDQMLVGFYGILTVEAMLLSKPVVCYIKDDIWSKIEKDCPIYNANPDNLVNVLEKILQNPSELIKRGEVSRNYALDYHSPKRLPKKCWKF